MVTALADVRCITRGVGHLDFDQKSRIKEKKKI